MEDISSKLIANAFNSIYSAINITLGTKCLIIDRNLEALINVATEFKISSLKKYGVTQILYFEKDFITTEQTLIYFLRTDFSIIKTLNLHMENKPNAAFHCFFSPMRSIIVEELIIKGGLCKNFAFHELKNINLLPIDYDILSMELYPK